MDDYFRNWIVTIDSGGIFIIQPQNAKGTTCNVWHGKRCNCYFFNRSCTSFIYGDLFGLSFFQTLGTTAGSLGGVAAAITVPLAMGANPVFAVVAGVVGGYGILPGICCRLYNRTCCSCY